MNRKSYLLFNLKLKRFVEWLADLSAEKPGASEFYLMARLMLKALLTGRSCTVAREDYFHRLMICHRCPIFDRKLKRCRKGESGCGCYVPFKALAPVDCWLRELDANAGWGISDYETNKFPDQSTEAKWDAVVADMGLD